MFLCALDPGTRATGYAVLREDEEVADAGTWRPALSLKTPLQRRRWLLEQLRTLIHKWGPSFLVYEEYVWQETATTGRSGMDRFMGGLEVFPLLPPYPVLVPLLPQVWGQQLYGHAQHSKAQIAQAVNLRLGTHYKGDSADNHTVDALGIALVALDNWRIQHRAAREGPRAVSPQEILYTPERRNNA